MARSAACHKNDIPTGSDLAGKLPIGRADDPPRPVALDGAADLFAGGDSHPDSLAQLDTVDVAGRGFIFHDVGDQARGNVIFPLGVQPCEISILI